MECIRKRDRNYGLLRSYDALVASEHVVDQCKCRNCWAFSKQKINGKERDTWKLQSYCSSFKTNLIWLTDLKHISLFQNEILHFDSNEKW